MIERIWEHAGMRCALRHGAFDAPCGYVFVPEGHPLHGVRQWDMADEPDVHGGITFAGRLDGLGWAVGFDMAHYWDLKDVPGSLEMLPLRSDDDCARETDRLAERLAEMGGGR